MTDDANAIVIEPLSAETIIGDVHVVVTEIDETE
jgi:hypothetical protein